MLVYIGYWKICISYGLHFFTYFTHIVNLCQFVLFSTEYIQHAQDIIVYFSLETLIYFTPERLTHIPFILWRNVLCINLMTSIMVNRASTPVEQQKTNKSTINRNHHRYFFSHILVTGIFVN